MRSLRMSCEHPQQQWEIKVANGIATQLDGAGCQSRSRGVRIRHMAYP